MESSILSLPSFKCDIVREYCKDWLRISQVVCDPSLWLSTTITRMKGKQKQAEGHRREREREIERFWQREYWEELMKGR